MITFQYELKYTINKKKKLLTITLKENQFKEMLYILLIIVVVLLAVYQYLVWNNNYFKIHKVPHIKPDIGFGNIKNAVLMKEPLKKVYEDIYKYVPN